ncbi:MAG: PhoD-like phosphatase N-terminal domain-containing protein, partial [Calditrichota bacterium]
MIKRIKIRWIARENNNMSRGLQLILRCILVALIIILIWSGSPVFAPPRDQFKQNNRNAIALIVDGKYDAAIQSLQKELETYKTEFINHHRQYPVDLEALYGLAIAYANKGDLKTALNYVHHSLDAGLPLERYLAGPRDLMQPLVTTPEFQALMQQQNIELLHGPLLGSVTDSSARFWMRTVHEVPVEVRLSRSPSMYPVIQQAQGKTKSDKDYTTILSIQGLQPNTPYYYRLVVNGAEQPLVWRFCTFPVKGRPASFYIGFGGGAGFTPWHEYMWNTIEVHNPLAFLMLGDNVYIDHPTYPEVQRYCYYR